MHIPTAVLVIVLMCFITVGTPKSPRVKRGGGRGEGVEDIDLRSVGKECVHEKWCIPTAMELSSLRKILLGFRSL